MRHIPREVGAAYDRIAHAYAERNDAVMPQALISRGLELVQHLGEGGAVIDVGCGTGRDMAWLETHGLAVMGIDISSEMLRYARAKVRGSLFAMEMTRLGLRDSCFDGAWCCASLLHLPKTDAARALIEIRRVLKKGGVMMLSVQEGSGERWEAGYEANVRRFFARYSAEELRTLLPSTGFAVQDIQAHPGDGREWLVCTCLAE